MDNLEVTTPNSRALLIKNSEANINNCNIHDCGSSGYIAPPSNVLTLSCIVVSLIDREPPLQYIAPPVSVLLLFSNAPPLPSLFLSKQQTGMGVYYATIAVQGSTFTMDNLEVTTPNSRALLIKNSEAHVPVLLLLIFVPLVIASVHPVQYIAPPSNVLTLSCIVVSLIDKLFMIDNNLTVEFKGQGKIKQQTGMGVYYATIAVQPTVVSSFIVTVALASLSILPVTSQFSLKVTFEFPRFSSFWKQCTVYYEWWCYMRQHCSSGRRHKNTNWCLKVTFEFPSAYIALPNGDELFITFAFPPILHVALSTCIPPARVVALLFLMTESINQ